MLGKGFMRNKLRIFKKNDPAFNLTIIQDIAKNHKGKCLSKIYINNKTKLEFECSKKHIFWTIPSDIKRGIWCKYCSGTSKGTIEKMREIAAERGGKCISNIYKNSKTNLIWECKEGDQWEASPNNVVIKKSWCPKCRVFLREALSRTTLEQIFGLEFKKYRPKWLLNSNGNIMELDGYCDKLKIGFEYQGEQHYLKGFYAKNKRFLNTRIKDDQLKEKLCKEHKIHFVKINYWDDVNDYPNIIHKQLVKSGFPVNNYNFTRYIDFNKVYEHKKKIEEMYDLARSLNGECLSDKFVTVEHKLKWKCSKGHIWESTPKSVKRGDWCNVCAGHAIHSIEDVQTIAIKNGGRCLSKTYKNNKTKLKFECSKGHIWQAIPKSIIVRGSWCPDCAPTKKGTINEMREIAKSRGGKCLSDSYVNSATKLKWKCNEGHIWLAKPIDIKHGKTWCPTCSGNTPRSIEEMQEIAESRGGKCISDSYVNSSTKLKWQCYEGHTWFATPNNIKSKGTWCGKCAGNIPDTIEKMHEIAESRGGKCLSNTYVNSSTKLEWECSEGHIWKAKPVDIKFGNRNRKTGERNGTWCKTCSQTKP